MLRIVFSTEDLARVRIAERPDPLWETVLSLHQLSHQGRVARPYAQWVGWIRAVGWERVSPAARLLHELAPPKRYFPDFLTPAAARDGLDAGVDALLHTPRSRLRAEITRAGQSASLPSWTVDLASGKPARLDWLAAAVRSYHRAALAPVHDRIATLFDTHRAAMTSRLASEGVEAVLSGLGGSIRWERPVLSARYPANLCLELRGRGLTLVPSLFCRGTPVTLADDELDPVLVYPIDPPVGWMQPGRPVSGRDKHLAALIGEPRAQLLRALETPAGTRELGVRTGMSASSASEHTAILRNAGMVESTRSGRNVTHSLTPLGRSVRAGELRP